MKTPLSILLALAIAGAVAATDSAGQQGVAMGSREDAQKAGHDPIVLETIAWARMLKASCDIGIPKFQERSAEPYTKWRQRNIYTIQQLERNDALDSSGNAEFRLTPQKRDELVKQMENLSPLERRNLEDTCDELIDLFSRIAPDPHLSSPEKTWATFLGALKDANRKLAISCLTSIARRNFKHSVLEELSDEKLKELGNSFTEFHITMDLGDIREAVVVLQGEKAGMIYFQLSDKEWKISEM